MLPILTLALAIAPCVQAQERGCTATVTQGRGRPDLPGVILGSEYQAPELRIQVIAEGSGNPIANTDIAISYVWDYWDCSGSAGEWELAADVVQCRTDADGRLTIPAFAVRPRGWCGQPPGERRKPTFVRIDIGYGGDGCISEIAIHPDDIKRHVRTGEPIILEGGCDAATSGT